MDAFAGLRQQLSEAPSRGLFGGLLKALERWEGAESLELAIEYVEGHLQGFNDMHRYAKRHQIWPAFPEGQPPPLFRLVRVLDLDRSLLDASTAAKIAASPHVSGLTGLLCFANRFGEEGVRALAASPYLCGLAHLDLSQCAVTDGACEALAASKTLTGLRYLSLRFNDDIGPAGIEALAQSANFSQLQCLDLSFCKNIGVQGAKALAQSPHLDGLKDLKLSLVGMRDEGAEALLGSPVVSGLHSLDLGNNGLHSPSAQAIARNPMLADLRFLNLRRNDLDDAALQALAGSPHMAQLRVLDLGHNAIGEAGVSALAQSPFITRLEHLSLRQNQLLGCDLPGILGRSNHFKQLKGLLLGPLDITQNDLATMAMSEAFHDDLRKKLLLSLNVQRLWALGNRMELPEYLTLQKEALVDAILEGSALRRDDS